MSQWAGTAGEYVHVTTLNDVKRRWIAAVYVLCVISLAHLACSSGGRSAKATWGIMSGCPLTRSPCVCSWVSISGNRNTPTPHGTGILTSMTIHGRGWPPSMPSTF